MVASKSPSNAESAPRSRLSPETPAMMVRENRISAKNSGGPKLSAKDARKPAKKMSARFETKSAVQDAQSAMPSARPASPRSASGWPSRMVAEEAGVPGVL